MERGPAIDGSPRVTREIVSGQSRTIGTVKADTALVRKYPGVELSHVDRCPPAGDQWLHEIKLEGYRLLAFLAVGRWVRLLTRDGNDWTAKFPSISISIGRLKTKQAVLDMEALVMDPAGKRFRKQKRTTCAYRSGQRDGRGKRSLNWENG
jgi:hypothetical protein